MLLEIVVSLNAMSVPYSYMDSDRNFPPMKNDYRFMVITLTYLSYIIL